MFKRKLYNQMREWKRRSDGSAALLIEGARRVGKTTIAREFAEREYGGCIYIDFSKATKATRDLFLEQREDVGTFLRMLQLSFGTRLEPRNGVVIFDEVQRFPIAREYIKHLVADGRFDYIETGSLISIKKNVADIVIPSEEERLRLRPMDFEEYLWALDKDIVADELRHSFQNLEPLPDAIHAQCMRYFDEYLLVGGMPQSVSAFERSADFVESETVKRRILELYLEDIAKFGGRDARRARGIFQGIPGELAAGSKRFKFSHLGPGVRYEDCESALIWLEDAHMVNLCRRCNDPSVGYRLTADESALKCYMGDTGLLVTHAFADGPAALQVQSDIQLGRLSVNRGMLVENAVAQQLRASGHALFYHTWEEPGAGASGRPRPREIDFLVTRGYADAAGKLRVSPVEAKSSKSYSTVSLDDFGTRFGKRVGTEYVLHPKQLRVEGRRVYLPLYMAHLL